MQPASHYGMTRNKIKELRLSNSTVLKTCPTLSPMTTAGIMLKKNVLFRSYLTDISSFCRCVRFNRSDVSNRLSRFSGVERAFDPFPFWLSFCLLLYLKFVTAGNLDLLQYGKRYNSRILF